MQTGAITGYVDVAQVTLYAFWVFFAGLIWYLRREDKREGYPLVSELPDRVLVQGFPPIPPAKTFLLPHGGTEQAPRDRAEPPVDGVRALPWFGAPLEPGGNPMLAGIGSAAYANRGDSPELTYEGETRMAPLRVATVYYIEPSDPDPRGMTVVGADKQVAGVVSDIWIDRAEPAIRYLEITLAGNVPTRTVLLPMTFVSAFRTGRAQEVKVNAITAAQFAEVPQIKHPDQVTLLEEDRIAGYYAGGFLFAIPGRAEPLL